MARALATGAGAGEATRQRPRVRSARAEERWLILLFLAPTTLFMVLLLWVPLLQGVWMSFHSWPLMGEPAWRGLDNYRTFLGADYFWTSIQATLVYSLSTLFQLGLALAAALVLSQRFVPLKPLWRGVMLIAYAMPPVVVGAIWLFLLDPTLGLVTNTLVDWGVITAPIYWFAEPVSARWTITAVASWTFWPFMFLIILSAIQAIPQSQYELAEIYGANVWQRFRAVTWPRIQGAILVVVILRLAFNLAKIEQPFQLAGGGPGYETSVLSILMYRFAFMSGDFGMAFTVGLVLVLMTAALVLPFAVLYQRHLREVGGGAGVTASDDRAGAAQKLATLAGLLLLLALVLVPFGYVLVTAFKPADEIYDVSWWPSRISFASWHEVFVDYDYGRYLLNSLVAGIGSALLAVVIAVPGAYIFARKEFPFREPFFYMIVGTLIFPFILLIVPITIAWIRIGLFNTYPGLWLAFQIFAVPYSMWILRGYFARMPRNLEEAAEVYGCTPFRAFTTVILPLSRPVVVSVLFLAFLQGWSDFLFSNMLTTGDGPRTASVAIYTSSAGGERVEWGPLTVMTLVTGIPPVILYMLAQRHLSKTFAGAGH